MGLCKLGVLSHFSAQAKVSQFNMVLIIDEDVGRLDVSVEDFAAFSFFL